MTTKTCKKCGNPKIMYWCNDCEANFEDKMCPACGENGVLDKKYHNDCNSFSIKDDLIEALNHMDGLADIGAEDSEKSDLQKSYNFLFNFISNS